MITMKAAILLSLMCLLPLTLAVPTAIMNDSSRPGSDPSISLTAGASQFGQAEEENTRTPEVTNSASVSNASTDTDVFESKTSGSSALGSNTSRSNATETETAGAGASVSSTLGSNVLSGLNASGSETPGSTSYYPESNASGFSSPGSNKSGSAVSEFAASGASSSADDDISTIELNRTTRQKVAPSGSSFGSDDDSLSDDYDGDTSQLFSSSIQSVQQTTATTNDNQTIATSINGSTAIINGSESPSIVKAIGGNQSEFASMSHSTTGLNSSHHTTADDGHNDDEGQLHVTSVSGLRTSSFPPPPLTESTIKSEPSTINPITSTIAKKEETTSTSTTSSTTTKSPTTAAKQATPVSTPPLVGAARPTTQNRDNAAQSTFNGHNSHVILLAVLSAAVAMFGQPSM